MEGAVLYSLMWTLVLVLVLVVDLMRLSNLDTE